MAAAHYSPLSPKEVQDEPGDPLEEGSQRLQNAGSAVSSARSAKYYGETDKPSSEDEDEALLDKSVPTSPAAAEFGDVSGDNDEFDASPQVSRSFCYSQQ